MTDVERPRRALLVSGGNARAPVSQATLEGLQALHGASGYAVRLGVSAGSFEVSCAALDLLASLRAEYGRIDGTRDYMSPNVARLRTGLFTLRPLEDLIRRVVGPHWRRLRSLPVGVGVYDLADDRYRTILASEVGTLDAWVEATLASCAMHPVMRWYPVRVRGEAHPCVDGGVVHVVPDLPDWSTYAAIDVVMHSPIDRTNPLPPSAVDDLARSTARVVERMTDNVVEADLARLRGYAAAGKEVTVWAPDEWPGESFDASAETMRWRLDVLGPRMWANPVRL